MKSSFLSSKISVLSSRSAFTLVELMIVIAIIGVLAASLFPMMSGYMEKSRDTARTAQIREMHTAVQSYYDDTGSYPRTTSTQSSTGIITSTGSEWKTDLGSLLRQMLPKMPSDPISTQSYTYGYVSPTSYQIGVSYERAGSGPYCPTGFIRVPGSSEWSTADFCVSRYHMTYTSRSDNPSNGGWNTYPYTTNAGI